MNNQVHFVCLCCCVPPDFVVQIEALIFFFLENYRFCWKLGSDVNSRGKEGLCSLCHYDEMRTKVDCDSLLSLFETKFKTIASILMFRKKRMSLRKQKCLLIEILSLLNDLKENNLQLFFKKPLWLKTNHPPITDHLPTDPPKTDPILTDPIDNILFKRLASRRISILQNTNIAGKLQIYTLVYHLFDE